MISYTVENGVAVETHFNNVILVVEPKDTQAIERLMKSLEEEQLEEEQNEGNFDEKFSEINKEVDKIISRLEDEYRQKLAEIAALRKKMGDLKSSDQESANNQDEINKMILELEGLKSNDLGKIINWLAKFAPLSSRTNTNYDGELVLALFSKKGYKPAKAQSDESEGGPKHSEDLAIMAYFIIGQALRHIERYGKIHGSIHNAINEWHEKLTKKSQSSN